MAKLNYNSGKHSGVNGDLIGIFSTFCVLFGIIFTVLGIKLKWFKHRMKFDQPENINPSNNNNINNNNNNASSGGTDKFHSTSGTRYSQTLQVQGIFRKLQDDEILIERPKYLPPVRIKNSSQPLNLIPANRNNLVNSFSDESQSLTQFKNIVPVAKERSNNIITTNDTNIKNHRSKSQSPKRDHEQTKKAHKKDHRERSKSPKKHAMPNKEHSEFSKTNNYIPANQKDESSKKERLKSPKKESSRQKEIKNDIGIHKQPIVDEPKMKKVPKTRNLFNEEIIEESQSQDKKGVKFAENNYFEEIPLNRSKHYNDNDADDDDEFGEFDMKEIVTRRATGFTAPSKEQIEELEYLRLEDEKENSATDNYPGTLKDKNGQVVFKLEGLSDDDEDDNKIKKIKPFKIPTPEPRVTIAKSKEINEFDNKLDTINGNYNEKDDYVDDSWSAVRQQRNLTQEMAKHHQAIREAAQIKAAKRQLLNPYAYDLNQQHPEKPKSMRNIKRQQHEDDNSCTEA